MIDDRNVYLQSYNAHRLCVCVREVLPKFIQLDENVCMDELYHYGSLEQIKLDGGDDRYPIPFQRFASLHHGR